MIILMDLKVKIDYLFFGYVDTRGAHLPVRISASRNEGISDV